MDYRKLLAALLLFNLTVFVLVAACLPRPVSFSYQTGDFLDYLIASRTRWEIAWAALAGSLLLSGSICLAVMSCDQVHRGDGY